MTVFAHENSDINGVSSVRHEPPNFEQVIITSQMLMYSGTGTVGVGTLSRLIVCS